MIPLKPSAATRHRYVRNILATYKDATDDQRARGANWYRSAHELALFMSDGDAVAGAGVLAALSANKAWDINQRLARDAFDGNVHGHVSNALGKVAKILAGADPSDVLPMGLKTGNFYRCIADPDDAEAVVIDRHAHDVVLGAPLGDANRGLSSKGRYAVVSLAYRQAAAELGLLPMQVQATVWVVWTERYAGVKRRPTVDRYDHEPWPQCPECTFLTDDREDMIAHMRENHP